MTRDLKPDLLQHNERLIERVAKLERELELSKRELSETQVLLEGMSSSLQASTIEDLYQTVFSTLDTQVPYDYAMLLTPSQPGFMVVSASSSGRFDDIEIPVDNLIKSVLDGPPKAVVNIGDLSPPSLEYLNVSDSASTLMAAFSYQDSVCLLALFSKVKGAYLRKDARAIKRITGLVEQTLALVDRRFIELETQQLKQAQEQAEMNLVKQEKMASLGQLSAGIAHEINNPMSFIGSNIQLLEENLSTIFSFICRLSNHREASDQEYLSTLIKEFDIETIKQECPELIEDCKVGVSRVNSIVTSLKSYSQVNNANWKKVNVCEGIGVTLKILENELKYKAQIIQNIEPLPESYCIVNELNQVYLNLIINAVHSIEHSGTITINSYAQSNKIFIEIKDTGVGIPKDKLDTIFDPFYTTKEVGQGTGLGLSISHAIIAKHQGEIVVSSQVNKGSTFTIILPVLDKAPLMSLQGKL